MQLRCSSGSPHTGSSIAGLLEESPNLALQRTPPTAAVFLLLNVAQAGGSAELCRSAKYGCD